MALVRKGDSAGALEQLQAAVAAGIAQQAGEMEEKA
jgi:hypothetical protein